MAEVVMFMRDEMFSGEMERNIQFRQKVDEVARSLFDGDYTCKEYTVNTPAGFNNVFEENPDCQFVFTTENNSEAQYQACSRNIPTLEWRCFTEGDVVAINVKKEVLGNALTMYKTERTERHI